MRIDAHQHFWRYDAVEYPWIAPHWPIRQDYLPDDLAPLLTECRMDGCIAVQARQSLEETYWLLKLAEQHSMIVGVVGWVDLCNDHVADQLDSLAGYSKLVGVRHVVQDEPDDEFMLRNEFQRGIQAVQDRGLTYDLLIFPQQLPAACQLVKNFPQQRFVLDHLAKPLIKDGQLSPWDQQIQQLAGHSNVYCKISGMVTEARWHAWHPTDFEPYLDLIAKAFGPERLMFGSDWPVALLAGSYRCVYELSYQYVDRKMADASSQIFGENARRFYLERS